MQLFSNHHLSFSASGQVFHDAAHLLCLGNLQIISVSATSAGSVATYFLPSAVDFLSLPFPLQSINSECPMHPVSSSNVLCLLLE